jgi:pilus assembly protein CpaE
MTKNALESSSQERQPGGRPLSIVSVSLDDESRELLRRFVESVPGLHVRLQLDDYNQQSQDALLQAIGEPPPDICLIDFDRDRQAAVQAAQRIHAAYHGAALFAVSSDVRSELIIQAMRCGCNEYVVKPIGREELLSAVNRVGGQRREKREQFNGQVLAFTGAKGGCGVTMLATHLGALLAKSFGRRTLLVDLHPEGGDAALYLGQMSLHYNFFELLDNTHRLDSEFLQGFLLHHSSGLELLPAPEASEPVKRVSPDALGQTFDFLRQRFEFILVDLPPGCGETNLEMIRYSDHTHLVTVAEVPALRNTARYLDYLSRMQHLDDRIRVVLNRHLKHGPITDEQIEKAIRKSIFWRIPNHYSQVVATINTGDPVAGLNRSEVTRNLMRWAESLGSKPEAAANGRKKSGLLSLFNQ